MRSAGQKPEHLRRVGLIRGLPEDTIADHDCRVHSEHQPLACLTGHRTSLTGRVRLHELRGREPAHVRLLVAGRDHLEGKPELFQDGAALRRRGRQEQWPPAHRLRARQICSDGHRRAHQRSGRPG